jgi:hypothetical protein
MTSTRTTGTTNPKTTILRTIEPGNINPWIITCKALLGMMTGDRTESLRTMKE